MKGKLNKNEKQNKQRNGGRPRGVSNGGFTDRRPTPFADSGREIGGVFGMPSLGKSLGGIIGHVFGSGDYTENFSGIRNNSLVNNSAPVPSFGSTESTIIEHREYIQDVISSPVAGAFTIQQFAINPGQGNTFPWLADLAANFEEYEIMGMIFEFKAMSGMTTSSTNTALGSVILATEYDPTKPAFSSKLAMENYFFSQSTRPDQSVMHAIECKSDQTPVKRLYIRNGNTTGLDIRWSDYANFFIASTGLPGASVNMGELWVTYKVKLHKPRLPITIGEGGQIACQHLGRVGVTNANILGTANSSSSGTLGLIITGNVLSWVADPQATYLITVNVSAGTSTTTYGWTSPVGLSGVSLYTNNTQGAFTIASASGQNAAALYIYKCTGTNGPTTVSITATGVFVGTTSLDLFVTQLDNTLTS